MTFLEYQNMEIDKLFLKLSKSKFRSRFHLTKKDKDYINSKGIDVIKAMLMILLRSDFFPVI